MLGLALIMLGWGVDDLRELFLNPARAGLAALALAGVVAVVLSDLDLHPLAQGSHPTGSQSLQLGTLLLFCVFMLWFLPFADRRSILTLQPSYWRYLGLLLCAIGITVRVCALRALGKFFSAYVTLQPGHRLVRHGIYRRIRHPLYLSLLLAPPGIALVFASLLAAPVALLAIVFVWDRIRKEERLLAVRFGLDFEDYRRCAWKLIPHVL
jgi:protein-S-isoprenylcysteine O-methyltransferase Ste14